VGRPDGGHRPVLALYAGGNKIGVLSGSIVSGNTEDQAAHVEILAANTAT
jgi:hypothetical protein